MSPPCPREAETNHFEPTCRGRDDRGEAGIINGGIAESQAAATEVDLLDAVFEIPDDVLEAEAGSPCRSEDKLIEA